MTIEQLTDLPSADLEVMESVFPYQDWQLYRRDRNHIWETNFVPDVRTLQLYSWKARGAGGRTC